MFARYGEASLVHASPYAKDTSHCHKFANFESDQYLAACAIVEVAKQKRFPLSRSSSFLQHVHAR